MKNNNIKENGEKKAVVYEVEDSQKESTVVREARLAAYDEGRIYTYEDYLNWPEDDRVELIDGKIYYMSAPTEKHQRLLGDLHLRFGNYLHGKACTVYISPFDVRIDLEIGKDSVVQPDLVMICNLEKLDEEGLNGSPDLVVEVLSPSNPNHDKVRKYNKYLSVGVKEYWIVDPKKEEVLVNILKSGYYESESYVKGDIIKVSTLDDLFINVTDLFNGYQGAEIAEVEAAREDEFKKASAQEEKAREEERAKAEAEKIEIARSLSQSGMPASDVSKHLRMPIEQIVEME